LPSNNLLIYTTGGFAYGLVKENVALNTLTGLSTATGGFSFNCSTGFGCFVGSSSRIDMGWTLGAGGEYALWNNTSVRLEYLYVNLGRGDAVNVVAQATQFGPATTPSSFTATYSTLNFHVVRAGLNWRF
jgi:outer membrane immunogenic protein